EGRGEPAPEGEGGRVRARARAGAPRARSPRGDDAEGLSSSERGTLEGMKPEAVKQTARARAGGQALGELQKAIRFFRLYPHTHPFCTQAVDASEEHLKRFLEKSGALDVEIRRDGCYIEDALVLPDSGQSTDLTALLYPEGIRALTLEVGLPRQEIFDFVEILSAHYPEKP